MKISVKYTKAEEDERDLRRFAHAALTKTLNASFKNKRYSYVIDVAIAALQYEWERCKQSKKRSPFLKWLDTVYMKPFMAEKIENSKKGKKNDKK